MISKLDSAFSQYIRQKNANEHGLVKCYTCETVSHWKEMDCSHFIKREHRGTRWHENNCRPACQYCNRTLNGNLTVFEERLTLEIGKEAVEELKRLSRQAVKHTKYELQELLTKYKNHGTI